MSDTNSILPIERRLLVVRGVRVILDSDLATLYGVPVKRLNEQIKRNGDRFPSDFAFQLTREEIRILRSQSEISKGIGKEGYANLKSRFATSSLLHAANKELGDSESRSVTLRFRQHGGTRQLPFVFTEHGVIQAANVLRSPQAIQMGIALVRAFVRLRQVLVDHKALAAKLDELDARVSEHDHQLADIVAAIRGLLAAPRP